MFTHQKTLDVINAGLIALGAKPLDGIPVAAPGHTDKCVLGCSYRQFGGSLADAGHYAEIEFDAEASRDAVLAAWQAEGVECREGGTYVIRFSGGLLEWMQAFDGGKWMQLVVPTFSEARLAWDDTHEPGESTVDPAELPPISA